MVKLFVTGDNHIGKKYDRYPLIKSKLIESRFVCLQNAVMEADKEKCQFFVITGDLFDNVSSIAQKDVRRIVEILSKFSGQVLILPGNHDFYSGEEKLWRDFSGQMDSSDNILLLKDFSPVCLEAGDERVTFYPALCQTKHSKTNNLDWIRNTELDDADYHVGLAHGAIQGLTPDQNQEYFLMTEDELNGIPMDCWLIGHTHIPYPCDLPTNTDSRGYHIFNPGTHEQTDLSNNTPGLCFVITLKKENDTTVVLSHSWQSGRVRYYDLSVQVNADVGLEKSVTEAISGLDDNSIVRLKLSGNLQTDEYLERFRMCDNLLNRFLAYEINDDNLAEQITAQKIRSEFAEISFAYKFLNNLTNNPAEAQLAYELIQECRK